MTNDEIDKLEAGRDLDALIAEKVFGWHGIIPMTEYNLCWGFRAGTGRREDDKRETVKSYSSDIRAAWEVIEKTELLILNELSFDHGYRDDEDDETRDYLLVNSHSRDVLAIGSTAPLAICRAALKAVNAP